MQDDARPKVKAALMRVEKNLNGKESIPTPKITSSSINTGTTKKEAVAFPRFKGAEKPGGSSFPDFPVWLSNWNQHVLDYEEKSRGNVLLSRLVGQTRVRFELESGEECLEYGSSNIQSSLNQLRAKGPDRHLNSLAAVIIEFRAERFAALREAMKMFNAVELDTRCFPSVLSVARNRQL